MYTHISLWERWQIYTLIAEGMLQKDIATRLCRSASTISNEIKRWSIEWQYCPMHAQRMYELRKSEVNKWRSKIKGNPNMQMHIRKRIQEDWRPPDAIAGRDKIGVCSQTIYNYIREWEEELQKNLTYNRWYKKRWKVDGRGKKKGTYKSITERSEAANKRLEIWHMEIDTIHSSWWCRTWWLVTIVDRMVRYVFCDSVENRKAKTVWDCLISLLSSLPKEKLLTITSDNWKEFNDFLRVEKKLDILFYFAHAYASCERWTNEQTNGMIRKYFPKWTDFSKVNKGDIQEVIHKINHRPRKSLWYSCAHEAFYWVTLDL